MSDEPARLPPWLAAAQSGNLPAIRSLLEDAHAEDEGAKCKALCWAAYWGQLEVISYLVEAGVSVNAPTGRSQVTPLMMASMFGRTHAIRYLLAHGADIHAAGVGGATALSCASANGQAAAVDYLLAKTMELDERPL